MSQNPTRRSQRVYASETEIARLKAEHAQQTSQRAELAGESVMGLFAGKLAGLPTTLLGKTQVPDQRKLAARLANGNYWWQAQLLDCTIDAALRAHSQGHSQQQLSWFDRAQRVLRGIRARNLGSFSVSYYDDMAWLTLAAGRLNGLSRLIRGRGHLLSQEAGQELYRALARGATEDLGGGMFWNKDHSFKNTPATAPAALAFVRGQQTERAASLLNWLNDNLWDEQEKIYLDGIKIGRDGQQLETGRYTYNQGPVLAAMLETEQAGGQLNCDVPERIAQVLAGIEQHFVQDFELSAAETIQVIRTQGSGDAGLFTGILARYLAQVALQDGLAPQLRERAGDLVIKTAELLWEGRREFDPQLPLNEPGIDVTEIRGQARVLFSSNVVEHSSVTLRPGAAIELAPQLQAWMILEAAAKILRQDQAAS